MALLPVTHKPITGQARQFDGTLEAFLDIIDARSKAGLSVTCTFDDAGNFVRLRLDGGGNAVTVDQGDWLVFPSNGTAPIAMTNTQALAEWQA